MYNIPARPPGRALVLQSSAGQRRARARLRSDNMASSPTADSGSPISYSPDNLLRLLHKKGNKTHHHHNYLPLERFSRVTFSLIFAKSRPSTGGASRHALHDAFPQRLIRNSTRHHKSATAPGPNRERSQMLYFEYDNAVIISQLLGESTLFSFS